MWIGRNAGVGTAFDVVCRFVVVCEDFGVDMTLKQLRTIQIVVGYVYGFWSQFHVNCNIMVPDIVRVLDGKWTITILIKINIHFFMGQNKPVLF